MKKEHVLVVIIGMFLLSYLLEAIVDPLQINLITPYHFLNPEYITRYPFTTTTIFIRALAIFITPLWLFSFFQKAFFAKGSSLLVLAALMQLYALQEIATKAQIIPLEWSLSLAIAGAALLIPTVIYFIRGSMSSMSQNLLGTVDDDSDHDFSI